MPVKLTKRGQIYYLRGTVAGQHVRESTGLGDKRAAELYKIRREAEILERAALGRQATITFAEAALTYMQAGGETRFLAPILNHFGAKQPLHQIDNEMINRAARSIYPDAAPATLNRQLITPISAVYTMAADDGHVPHRRFKRRKVDNARTRWLTPKEAEDLMKAADAMTRLKITLLLGTGLRTGELFALTRDQLHIQTGEIWIAQPKNGHPRMTRMPTRTARALRTADLPEAGAVFLTPKRQAYKRRHQGGGQMQTAFNAARDKAGLGQDVTPHVLRHTWATWFYAQTRDFGGLMDQGGWMKADMANRYRKIAPAWLPDQLTRYGWHFGEEPQDASAVLNTDLKAL